jgi:hypothetical protein
VDALKFLAKKYKIGVGKRERKTTTPEKWSKRTIARA